jgi:hypothetical protein
MRFARRSYPTLTRPFPNLRVHDNGDSLQETRPIGTAENMTTDLLASPIPRTIGPGL